MINNMLFNYSAQYFGGTEYMARYFQKHIAQGKEKFYKYQCYVIPGNMADVQDVIKDERDIILWMHVLYNQVNPDFLFYMKDPRILNKIKYVVTVSEWAKQEIMKELNLPDEQVFVVNNAFDHFEKNTKKFDNVLKPKIIHTSAPDRGLDVLLRSIKYVDEDFELQIFSNIMPDTMEHDNSAKDAYNNDSRVRFFGQTPRKTVQQFMQEAHIFAYPSADFIETFCISLTEALSAECLAIYPDYGSLKEVSNGFGIMYEHTRNRDEHAKIFAKHLTAAIKQIKNGEFNPGNQAEVINEKYSWDKFKNQWEIFYNTL